MRCPPAHCTGPTRALWWSPTCTWARRRGSRRWGARRCPHTRRARRCNGWTPTSSATGASRVICLGDSFDAPGLDAALPEDDLLWITRLQAGRDWIWIAGNHDPASGRAQGRAYGRTPRAVRWSFAMSPPPRAGQRSRVITIQRRGLPPVAGSFARPCFLARRAAPDPARLRRLYGRSAHRQRDAQRSDGGGCAGHPDRDPSRGAPHAPRCPRVNPQPLDPPRNGR